MNDQGNYNILLEVQCLFLQTQSSMEEIMDKNKKFEVVSEFKLAGDQPRAVEFLTKGIENGVRDQVLLGVTGSGKTFSMAHIIARTQRTTIIMAPNKTLAAQIYSEMKEFFPHNAVEYFVSYYDYYQPEAYIAKRDLYIEKDSSINEQIDLMRHSATRSVLERKDVIIVCSVSCIYGIGSPELYSSMVVKLSKGMKKTREDLITDLVRLQYERNEIDFSRGHFRVRGDFVDLFPSHSAEIGWKIEFFGDEIISITEFDSLTGKKILNMNNITIYANSHYVTPRPTIDSAIKQIKIDLKERLAYFYEHKKLVEEQRLRQRTEFDLEMMVETGSCKGIENYSRYLTGKPAGAPPPTLFEYLPHDALLFIDESHVSVPQVRGMYNGDLARKSSLVEHGFRLPAALDNRPLKFEEWDEMRPQTIFVSATPGKIELELAKHNYVEQIIRPTGLIDPVCEIRPTENQIDDLVNEIKKVIAKGQRILVTTLTKKMAEKISEYLAEINIKVTYLHSEVNTLERMDIIRDLRKGDIDVLVGINLLREGLDIPECALVAILDADKEGFLRSETALIQTIGRVARNVDGRAILYADNITGSIERAISETNRRRTVQLEYNQAHGITPQSVKKSLNSALHSPYEYDSPLVELGEDAAEDWASADALTKEIKALKKKMLKHAENLEFEKASEIRDKIAKLEKLLLE